MNRLLLKENHSSANLWEKIQLLTDQQILTIAEGLEWTTGNLKDAVIIGGTAVVHYVNNERELTPDLDFMVDDIDIVKDKLSNDNIVYDNLYTGIEKSLGITANQLNTDFLCNNVGNIQLNKLILEEPQVTRIGGYQVNIIKPELLAIMKLIIGRDKDFSDGMALLSSGNCDRDKYKTYLMQLKTNLQDFESIWSYNELIK